MNTTMADGASERLDAQIADALFGQPGMSKVDVANRLRELRGTGAPLLRDTGIPVSPSPASHADDAVLAAVATKVVVLVESAHCHHRKHVESALYQVLPVLRDVLAARQPVAAVKNSLTGGGRQAVRNG